MDQTFDPMTEQLADIADLPVPWWVAGGWAIDLFVDRVTRDHHDLDLVVARDDQRAVFEYLADRDWSQIVPHPDGLTGEGTIEAWNGAPLSLPIHQILADTSDGVRIEFQLSEIEEGLWQSRLDPELAVPAEAMALTASDGTPYVSPEIVLLDKAGNQREWDEAAFATALPEMNLAQRHWLFHALEQQHPGHPWMPRLGVT